MKEFEQMNLNELYEALKAVNNEISRKKEETLSKWADKFNDLFREFIKEFPNGYLLLDEDCAMRERCSNTIYYDGGIGCASSFDEEY